MTLSGVNAGAYHDDGTKRGLGGTAHLSIRHGNDPLILPAWNRTSVTVFQHGGNMNTISLNGTVERFNQGDGEWYLYQMLLSLSASVLGDLYVGGPEWVKYPNCLWVSGQGQVTCGTDGDGDGAWVEYQHEFIQSAGEKTEDLEKFQTGSTMVMDLSTWASGMPVFFTQYSEDPQDLEAWRDGMPFSPIASQEAAFTLPSEPAEYAGRDNTRTYTFAGVALGLLSADGLTIRCSREPVVNRIARCYGVSIKSRAQKRGMQIEVTGALDAGTYPRRYQAEEYIHEMANNLGDTPGDLVGNGNTFSNCHLRGCDFSASGQYDHLSPSAIKFEFEVPLA